MKKIIKKSLLAMVIASALPAVHAAEKSADTNVSSQAEKDIFISEKLDVNLAEQLGVDGSSSVTVTKAGASRLNIHFSEVSLQPGAYLRISSADGKQTEIINHAALYDGSGAGFDSMTIQGDSALVQLIYPDRNSRQVHNDRVIISDFSYSLASNDARAIIGGDQMVNAICYEKTKPSLYKGSLASVKIYVHHHHTGHAGYAAGFNLVGNNMVMTSQHIAGDAGDKSHLIEYNVESANCNSNTMTDYLPIRTEKVLIAGSPGDNDYAVYQIDRLAFMEAGIQQIFGNLALNPAAGKLPAGTPVYIPQYPSVSLKKIADRHDDGDACKIVSGGSTNITQFNCDSSGAVSGSPVIVQGDNTVAAIHGLSDSNSGPSAAHIYNQIKETMPWTIYPGSVVVGEGKLHTANRSQTNYAPAEPVVLRTNVDVKLDSLYYLRLKHFGSYSVFQASLRATGGNIETVNVRMQLRTPCGLTDLNATQSCATVGTRQLEMNVLPQDNGKLTSLAYNGWMTLRVTDRQNQLVNNLVIPYTFNNYDAFTSPFTPGTQVHTVKMTGHHLETPRMTLKNNFGFVAVHEGQGPLDTTTSTSTNSTKFLVPLKNAQGEVKLVNITTLRKFGCSSFNSGTANSIVGCGSSPVSASLDLRFWYGDNPGLPAGRYTGMLPLKMKGNGVEQAMLVNIDITI